MSVGWRGEREREGEGKRELGAGRRGKKDQWIKDRGRTIPRGRKRRRWPLLNIRHKIKGITHKAYLFSCSFRTKLGAYCTFCEKKSSDDTAWLHTNRLPERPNDFLLSEEHRSSLWEQSCHSEPASLSDVQTDLLCRNPTMLSSAIFPVSIF